MSLIAGIGLMVADNTLVLDTYPQEDDKVKAKDFLQEIGGPVPVALLYLKWLGQDVRLASAVGDDIIGEYLKKSLEASQGDTRFLDIQPGKSSAFAQIWLSTQTGKRTIVHSTGTLSPIAPSTISEDFLDSVALLHIDGHEQQAAVDLAKKAKEKGIRISYDAGTYKKGSEDLLQIADIVQAPIRFVRELQGITDLQEAASWLRTTYQSSLVVVTNGDKGVGYSSAQGAFYYPAYKVEPIVDSNGAGDVFAGALIFSLINKKGIEDAVRFASAAAALKCKRFGKKAFPTQQEIDIFLASHQ